MVYVDDAIWNWQGLKWCHLLADDIDVVRSLWVVSGNSEPRVWGVFAVFPLGLPSLAFGAAAGVGGWVRPPPHHPVRHGAVHHRLPGLGLFLRHRYFADVARH